MQRILLVVLIPLAVLLASCAKEPLKDAGLQGEGALSAVHGLAGAYSNRDLEAGQGLGGDGGRVRGVERPVEPLRPGRQAPFHRQCSCL